MSEDAQKTSGDELKEKPRMAYRSRLAVAVFLSLAVAGLAADLASKHCVFTSMLSEAGISRRAKPLSEVYTTGYCLNHELRLSRQVLGEIRFTLSTNPGVVFGLPMPPAVVAAVTLATLVLVLLFFATSPARAWSMHVALAFILAGALGNLYDRMFSQVWVPGFEKPILHEVRDFIDFSGVHLPFKIFGQDNYPWIFNVADVLLVVGVATLIISGLFTRKTDKPAAKPAKTN